MLYVQNHYYGLAVIFCACLTSFILYRYFHPISVVAKELNGKTIKEEKAFTFKFYEKYFRIQDKLQIDTVKYYQIRKIFETKSFFYLYIDRTHAFIINKENFLIGKPADFSEFLKKKCIFRFKKVK